MVYIFQSNTFFRYFIESLLKVSDIKGTVVLMLPLGFSIGILVNTFLYWLFIHKEFKNYSSPVLKTFFQITGASTIMGYVAYKFLDVFDEVLNINTLVGIFLQGFLSGIIGIIIGVLVLYLLNSLELKEVWNTLHKKVWKAKVVGPDPEL